MLGVLGENIKLACKRRKLTTIEVSERAGIDRTILYQIEKGNPSYDYSRKKLLVSYSQKFGVFHLHFIGKKTSFNT